MLESIPFETTAMRDAILRHYSFLINQGFKPSFYNDSYGYLGRGFSLGLENSNRNLRILFVKETEIPQIEVLIGTLLATFENPDERGHLAGSKGWFRLASLIEFLIGKKTYSHSEYEKLDPVRFQAIMSERLKPLLPAIFGKFENE